MYLFIHIRLAPGTVYRNDWDYQAISVFSGASRLEEARLAVIVYRTMIHDTDASAAHALT